MLTIACIPAYNEERTIAKVVLGCQAHVDKVFVYDDGSTDMTSVIAQRLGAEVIRQKRNMGKGEALRNLFRAARESGADVMVTIDADAQHDPDEIPALVEPISKGEADIVVGSRFITSSGSVPQHRRVVNRLMNAVTLEGVSDTQSGFRAYGKRAIGSIVPGEMGMGVDSEILMDAARINLSILEVPISVMYGTGKTSKLNPAHHSADVFFSIVKLTSIRHPLVFYGGAGLVFLLVGIDFIFRTASSYLDYGIITLTITDGLLAFALTMVGLLTLFVGVILFTISTLLRKEA